MVRRYCCVPDCPNFLGTWDSSVRFFISPKDPELKAKWEQALNRPSASSFRLCILHFDEKDIVTKKNTLRPGAIPKPVLVPKTEDAPLVKIVDIATITKRRLCDSCIRYDVQLQAANAKIAKMEERVAKLVKENLKIKKTLSNYTMGETLQKRMDRGRKCSLCEIKLTATESERHFCIEQENFICSLCPCPSSNTFQSTIDFIEHLSQHNKTTPGDKRSLFKCNQCSLAYPMEILLKCHQKSHDKIKPVKSKSNDKTADDDPTIAQSSTSSKPQRTDIKLFKCGLCEDTFRTTTELAHHRKSVHGKRVKRLQCFVCKLGEFATIAELRLHMKTHDSRECDICKTDLDFDALASHLCGDERAICCDYCPNQFTSTTTLVEHLENAHENNKKFYGCESCLKCFPMLILKEFHMKSHDKPRPFVCEICSKSFSSKKYLKNHQYLHNQTKPHLCDECGNGFRTARGLKLHKNSYIHKPNVDAAAFQCPDCPRKFNNPYNFRTHSAVHREHKYVCGICQTELMSKPSYKNHLKSHQRTEADRVYACKICTRKFFNPRALRNHRLVHTASKSHSCRFCGTTYKYSGDLNKHLKTHLGNIHECKKCLKRFKYPRELQKHEFEHYKEEKLANEMNR